MKKILLPSLLVCSLFANEQNFVEIGGGVVNYKDNFSTYLDKNISSLSDAKSKTLGALDLSFYYAYDLNEAVDIYINSGLNKFNRKYSLYHTNNLNLGTSFKTKQGIFDLGLKGNISEAWKNPFLTNTNREKTDIKEFGAYIGYGILLSKDFETMTKYEFSKKSYDKDDVIKALKRDGKRHILSIENTYKTKLFSNDDALIGNLIYEKYDADGKSSSYNQYSVEIGVSSQINENTNLFLLGNYGKRDYEKSNPQVNKNIDVDIYGIAAGIKFDKPFNYQNTYVNFKTGYEKGEANHNFYDKKNSYVVVSLGYKF